MRVNPFTPDFGSYPLALVKRPALLKLFSETYHPGVDPNTVRSIVLIGERGIGKTIMLDTAHDVAAEYGWVVVEVSGAASSSLAARVIAKLNADPDPPLRSRPTRTVGMTLGPATMQRTSAPVEAPAPASVEEAVIARLDRAPAPTGVLLSVDELHDVPRHELKELTNDVQLLRRRGARVAVISAGLPILDFADPATMPTFVARAARPSIGLVDDIEIRNSFAETLDRSGRTITPDGRAAVVVAAGGLPYAMQVVGYHLVDAAGSRKSLTLADVEAIRPAAHSTLRESLFVPYDIAPGARRFLRAIAEHGHRAKYGDVCDRLGATPEALSSTRARLIKAGHITSPERGIVELASLALRAVILTDPTDRPARATPSRMIGAANTAERDSGRSR